MSLFYKVLKGARKDFIFLPLFSAGISYIILLVPIMIQYAIDGVVFGHYEIVPKYMQYFFKESYLYNLIVIGVAILLLHIIMAVLTYLRSKRNTKFNLIISKNLKVILYSHIQKLEYEEFHTYSKDEMIQRLVEDSETFCNFLNTGINLIFDTVFIILFAIIKSMKVNFMIAVYLNISVFIMIIFAIWYYKKLKVITTQVIQSNKNLLSKTISVIQNYKILRMLNKQNIESGQYKKLNEQYTKARTDLINLILFHEIITDYINVLREPILYLIGGIGIIKKTITLGEMAVFMEYASNVIRYMISFGNSLDSIVEFLVIYQKLNDIMKLKKEEKVKSIPVESNGDILFLGVHILINQEPILKNINCRIQKGEIVAVVGDNGSGKSIFVKTLLGLYKYTGNICINNIDIKNMNQNEMRRKIAYVPSEAYLFPSTIKENICIHQEEQLEKILKISQLEQDLSRLQKGYDTRINEAGVSLSGGQRQRIAIARALMSKPNIMILDNSFSQMDQITKNKIIENLKAYKKDTTIFLVTHEIELTRNVDKIIFLNKGASLFGTKEELLNKSPKYKKMLNMVKDVI